MLMVCHHLDPNIPEDVAFADSRIRKRDDRRGGHPARSGRLLDDRVRQPGHGPGGRGADPHLADRRQDEAPARRLPEETGDNDNFRIKRYIAKYTINPALTHGASRNMSVRSRPASYADLVLWSPAFFGVKPDLVLKNGTIVAAPMGDPNASIPTPEPVHYRPMFGAFGRALTASRQTYVSQAAPSKRVSATSGTGKGDRPGHEDCRSVRKADMVLNDFTPEIEVDPETYEVRAATAS